MNKVILTLVALFAVANTSASLAATFTADLSNGDVTANTYTATNSGFSTENNDQGFEKEINTFFVPNLDSDYLWTEKSKYNVDTGADGKGLTVAAGSDGWISGSWSFAGQLTSPFVIVIKASNAFAAYLFQNLPEVTSISGSFDVAFLKNNNTPNLSHMTLYTASKAPSVIIPPVPVPAALWLFAPALIGMMGFRRRKSA